MNPILGVSHNQVMPGAIADGRAGDGLVECKGAAIIDIFPDTGVIAGGKYRRVVWPGFTGYRSLETNDGPDGIIVFDHRAAFNGGRAIEVDPTEIGRASCRDAMSLGRV